MTDWEAIRREFQTERGPIQLSALLLSSHPSRVRVAIDRHRQEFDRNPAVYFRARIKDELLRFAEQAGRYFEVRPEYVAEVTNTTLGLAVVYSGIRLLPGERILTTEHDFTATSLPLEARARRQGTPIDRVRLFDSTDDLRTADIVARLAAAIDAHTRLIALTWVHSSTGVKLPLPDIAAMVRDVNRSRTPGSEVLISIDGVHGFGVENATLAQLGADFFAAGCHKWIFGPRGTGVLYGTARGFAAIEPIAAPLAAKPEGWRLSPTGVQPYDHRFAAADAFEWLMEIGKGEIEERVHDLATILKQGLRRLGPRVRLVTPEDARFSSGIVCFDIEGADTAQFVDLLKDEQQGVIATTSAADPLAGNRHYVRLTPSLMNNEDDLERAMAIIARVLARLP